MKSVEKSLLKASKVALISIHPKYADKIISGEKKFEFRRGWTKNTIDFLVVYSTNPVKKIVAILEVGKVYKGNKKQLWEIAVDGGGVTKKDLFSYLEGKDHGVAIEIRNMFSFGSGISPSTLLGESFRAPQSFRYLDKNEILAVYEKAGGFAWA